MLFHFLTQSWYDQRYRKTGKTIKFEKYSTYSSRICNSSSSVRRRWTLPGRLTAPRGNDAKTDAPISTFDISKTVHSVNFCNSIFVRKSLNSLWYNHNAFKYKKLKIVSKKCWLRDRAYAMAQSNFSILNECNPSISELSKTYYPFAVSNVDDPAHNNVSSVSQISSLDRLNVQ